MKLDSAQAVFSHLLVSGTLVHEGSFAELQRALGIEVRPQVAMALSIDRYPDLALGQPFSWRMEIGQQLVEAIREAIRVPYVWVWAAEGVLCVLLELQGDSSGYKTEAVRIARDVQKRTDARGFAVSAGIGAYYDNPYMLHYSFEEAKESMVDRFFQGNRIIFVYERGKKSGLQQPWKKAVMPEERAELLARVRIGDEEGSVAHLKILLERLAQSYKHSVDMFKSEAYDLVLSLSRTVLDLGGDAAVILSENARVLQDLSGTIRYDKFVLKVCDYWRKLAKQAASMHGERSSPAIRSAIAYIKEHLGEKMTLDQIAQYCHLSLSHFSHLFKKETGMSFVDFVNKLRIEKSLHYLETSELTIQEIAGRVGFPDANYFARKFKAYMNATPNEYRTAKLC
ncbi:AraC family transcriptional regulator [Paenibacillus flagellatus]|uniref:AraC family transcriptional regulator n=1 Tax=Paenibacillus flagellatus TaxID=2211139 RepID=A0A2V5K3G3_9BACL|nr:AraC family transcriptional regulator [Paenibacillus flagellatus]PYI53795.1 AraC family transcriptional regulator [Paenibacillus flagellatus]